MIYVGIDTGTNTGLAVWDSSAKKLLCCETLKLHMALWKVKDLYDTYGQIVVFFEDARLRKWIPQDPSFSRMKGRLQGAGSVKRDSSIWEDFCKDLGVEYHAIAPKNNLTKASEEFFKAVTKWEGRTSEHARDAAFLVINR